MSQLKTKGKRIAEHAFVIATFSIMLFMLMEVAFLSYFHQWGELVSIKEWFIENLLKEVGFDNNRYINVPEVSDTFLYGSFTASLASIALGILIVWFFRIRNFDWSQYKHLDGPLLLKGRTAAKHFRKKAYGEGDLGLSLHPTIFLPIIREAGNILVWGMQGAGKSNFIKSLVNQLISKRERMLLYDIKGEYTQSFLNEDSLLLSPKDKRSVNWNLGKDLANTGLAQVFAESVIPADSAAESFWVESARTILVGVIVGLSKEYANWSWCALEQRLFCSDEELSSWLEKYHKQAATLIKPDSKTTLSIRSMLATKLAWLKEMTEYVSNTPPDFSISGWLTRNDKTTLIVQGDLASPLMGQALITAFMSVMSSYILTAEDNEEQKTWLVLDELATLNRSKSFERWLALGRSKGCRTIAGTQLMSQLHSIYGRDNANTIIGLFSNVVAFRVAPDDDSASKASAAFGQRRVEKTIISINENGEKSRSFQQEKIPLVTPEDLVHLPQPTLKRGIDGYLLIGGTDAVYKLNWPIGMYSNVAEAVIRKTPQAQTSPVKGTNRLNRRNSR